MTIYQFLLKLAGDENLLRAFREDPESVLTGEHAEGLNAEQKAVLRAGKLGDLRVKIKAEFDVLGETATLMIITIHTPPRP
jgi:hypothetical protein